MALLLELAAVVLSIVVVGVGAAGVYAHSVAATRLKVVMTGARLRWGLHRLGWTPAVVEGEPGSGEPEAVLVRTYPDGRVVLRPGPSGGWLDGELCVSDLPTWLRVTADADREPGVAVGELHLPPALVMPDELVTRVVVALENGGWIGRGRMGVAVGRNLLPLQLEAEARRLMDTATRLRGLPDRRVEGVDRLWRDARYRGRAAAAQWLVDHRPERREALLAELSTRPEGGLRLVAAAALGRADILEELVRTATTEALLTQASAALARVARPSLGAPLAARVRAQAEPWGALLACVRTWPDPEPVEALWEVVAGTVFLLDPADTLAVLSTCCPTWELALAARVRQAPDAGLHTEVLEVVKALGAEATLDASAVRLHTAPGPRLAWQLNDAMLTIRRRLGLTQDGEVALVEAGGHVALAGGSGEVALAPEQDVREQPVPRVIGQLGDGVGIK